MKLTEPNQIALFNASLISLALSILFFLFQWLTSEVDYWWPGMFFILSFILIYFFFKYSLERFIYNRIKLIYHNIFNVSFPGNNAPKNKKMDLIEEANQAVIEWGKRQKEEIESLKNKARYRREFLGNISHELKTPIFNIQGYVLTLLDGALEDKSINKKYLLRAEKSINRMIAIVDDLEEIAKLESGELTLNKEEFDFNSICRDVVDFMDIKIQKHNSKITYNNRMDKPRKVLADKKRIRQVLINLIDNALKYGDKEKTIIEINSYDFDETYLFEVKDNGMGIPSENLPRVFERFYRTDKGRSVSTGGTGLGLAIVKHIIEAHGQTIKVKSKEGEGTAFSFSLQKA